MPSGNFSGAERKKMNKGRINHVRARARQRIGMDLTKAQINQIESWIEARWKVVALEGNNEATNRSIWSVNAFGSKFGVIYDDKSRRIVTVLGLDLMRKYCNEYPKTTDDYAL